MKELKNNKKLCNHTQRIKRKNESKIFNNINFSTLSTIQYTVYATDTFTTEDGITATKIEINQ